MEIENLDYEFSLEMYLVAVRKFEDISLRDLETNEEKARARQLMNIIIALREQLESVYYEDLFDMSDSDLIRYEDHKKIYNKSTKRIIEKKNK